MTDFPEHSRQLMRNLGTGPEGLSTREAERRLQVRGPNEIADKRGRHRVSAMIRQFTHPLALLLWLAAVLAAVSGVVQLGLAIVAVIVLNAILAYVQEQHAEHAVAALSDYVPQQAWVVRDGRRNHVLARELVPGDLLVVEEGDQVSADAQLISGAVEVDMAVLTGESNPVERDSTARDIARRPLDSPILVFSGTTCISGTATGIVTATGSHTELGRIAALTRGVRSEPSPLELQVRRVAWLIAAVAVGVGALFLPLGLLAGLSPAAAFVFTIGLLVANVPEGMLPTITLALAAGSRTLAGKGAVVKRLSSVETLGCTTVICTDKTGTLTANRMRVTDVASDAPSVLVAAAARCTTADLGSTGDPTELALLSYAAEHGQPVDPSEREAGRRKVFRFETHLKRMSTVDVHAGSLVLTVKGAPEEVLPLCSTVIDARVNSVPLDDELLRHWENAVTAMTGQALRVLAVATRGVTEPVGERDDAESGLCLLGLLGLLDPPRPEVRAAVTDCHSAGIRIHVVTGDNGRTATEIAKQVGIDVSRSIDGHELDTMSESQLDALLGEDTEVVFSRASPEAKLRIADALRDTHHVVAMTGDGVNDAPALRRADIGIAMGCSGTDVARQAATVVLTDDNFATIAIGIREGRRVFANVRKFVLYIFAHSVPEVVPFLVFALSGGMIPLPLTVLQILAIDLGTETLPALALGREPAEPGLMAQPPRPTREGVITRQLLWRAWALMGGMSALLALGAFLIVLVQGGWHPGDDVSTGTPLHETYLQATTVSFLSIVACQIGTAMAARTSLASLRSVGLTTNRLLVGGIAFEIMFAAALVYMPPLQTVFGTAGVAPWMLLMMLPMPVAVWGIDEAYRCRLRRHADASRQHPDTLASTRPTMSVTG